MVGLCHSVQFTIEDLCALVDVPESEITFLSAGINHQAFILRFEQGGESLYPRLDARIAGDAELQRRVRVALYRRFGFYPTESSEHAAEYVPWFMGHDDEVEQYRIPIDDYISRSEANLVEYARVKESLARGETIEVARSNEYASTIIHSIVTGEPSVIYGNVQNTGLISDLAGRRLRRGPVSRRSHGVRPTVVSDYPAQLAALNRTYVSVVDLTVRAVLESRPDHVRHAAMLDPATAAVLTLAEIDALCDDLTLRPRRPHAARLASGRHTTTPHDDKEQPVSGITLDAVTKVYPNGVKAVDALSLEIAEGEFCVLVGPSGCGKSTLLRMIAGLEEITDGDLMIGGVDVTEKPPQERDIAMIFQNYALYPHMTVRGNLAFGLKLRKVPKAEWQRRVDEVAETLGLGDLLDRKPSALSGGQRQRVAMGRAIVREPKAFLMDEPLSNLDAKLRVSMRANLAKLHERLRVTTVYVTHDQVEAMTLGQRVAVLRDGLLQQYDTPQNLFRHPANLFVAAFIGSPSMNLVDAAIDGDRVLFAGFNLALPAGSPLAGQDRKVILGIRPTDFDHAETAQADFPRITVRADIVEDLGSESHVIFSVDAPTVSAEAVRAATEATEDEGMLFAGDQRAVFTASLDARRTVSPDTDVMLAVDHRRFHFFDPTTGLALATPPTAGADA